MLGDDQVDGARDGAGTTGGAVPDVDDADMGSAFLLVEEDDAVVVQGAVPVEVVAVVTQQLGPERAEKIRKEARLKTDGDLGPREAAALGAPYDALAGE